MCTALGTVPGTVKCSINKYLFTQQTFMTPYQKPDTVLGSADLAVTKTDTVTALPEHPVWWARRP